MYVLKNFYTPTGKLSYTTYEYINLLLVYCNVHQYIRHIHTSYTYKIYNIYSIRIYMYIYMYVVKRKYEISADKVIIL